MKYLFSPSVNAFYPNEMKSYYEAAGSLPADLIEVDSEVFDEFSAIPEGKVRVVNNDGMPAWVDMPPPTREELISAAEQMRQQLLTHADAVMLDWRTELMLGEISDANRGKLSAWLAYKNEVKTWDIKTDPENVNWPVSPQQ
ncbi:tail fiber assembly protein [Citrobacter freundii]|nr:tail fiber assembly protein [Citrobacter freundii]QMM95878.1 tail fiber assembly protein [Citrobacter freundii]